MGNAIVHWVDDFFVTAYERLLVAIWRAYVYACTISMTLMLVFG
jgi:hypothetical protein